MPKGVLVQVQSRVQLQVSLKQPSPTSISPHAASLLLKRISFLLISFIALFLSFRNIYGEDVGFHLRAAEWMLDNYSLPPNSAFIYSHSDKEYIDLNWLYQLALYATWSMGGSTGMILLNSAFIFGAIYFMFRRIRNWNSLLLPWGLLVAVLAVSSSFEIRPHSLSWLLLGLTLHLLQEYCEGNEKAIRWLPPVMLLWVNTHSLFILGLVALGCYTISIFLRNKFLPKTFLVYGSAAVLACFINPYGWNGFTFPFEQALALQEGNIFKENIRELQSPFEISEYELSLHNIFASWHFFDLFAAIIALGFLFRFRQFRIHEWLIAIIFFYFATTAAKNIGYFIFAITPIVTNVLFAGRTYSPKQNQKTAKNKYYKPALVTFILISAILLLTIRTNAFYIHYRLSYRFGFGWNNSNLPVKATDFMLKNNLQGKILNQLDYGGYLEFFAKAKTAIDGRLDAIGETLFNEHINAKNDADKLHLIQKYDPEIIIFSYFITPDWIVFLQKHPDWRLAYVDGNAAIYLLNDYSPDIPAMDEGKILSTLANYSDPQIDSLAKEKQSASVFASLFSTQYFPEEEHNLIAFCFYQGWFNAAKQVSANAFTAATSDYPEMFQNLGSVYFQLRDKERALYLYQQFLSQRKNEQVAERVQFLKGIN